MDIQPRALTIPKDNPFKNDLLNRKEAVEILARLFASIDGPCVLAVDAAWGAGKTTFLSMLSQHLQSERFQVVNFNAWKTDFTGDPFIALSEELADGLREYAEGEILEDIVKLKKAASEVLRRALPGALRIATSGLLNLDPLLEKEFSTAVGSYAADRLKNYVAARGSLSEFRTSLSALAAQVAKSKSGLPLLVLVDELDRCRPSYAIELLESAKHLFNVDHVVFVLAINRDQLACSIKAVYGSDFDAKGYLDRFININFRLPSVDQARFIEDCLKRTKMHEYIDGTRQDKFDNMEMLKLWLVEYFVTSNVSLREAAQAIHHLGLVFASLERTRRLLAHAAAFALILRTINPDLYRKFIAGDAEDRTVLEYLSAVNSAGKLHGSFLEATIIICRMEVQGGDRSSYDEKASQLLQEYNAAVKEDSESAGEELLHARAVIRDVQNISQYYAGEGIGFLEAVRRIELLSPSLGVGGSAE